MIVMMMMMMKHVWILRPDSSAASWQRTHTDVIAATPQEQKFVWSSDPIALVLSSFYPQTFTSANSRQLFLRLNTKRIANHDLSPSPSDLCLQLNDALMMDSLFSLWKCWLMHFRLQKWNLSFFFFFFHPLICCFITRISGIINT